MAFFVYGWHSLNAFFLMYLLTLKKKLQALMLRPLSTKISASLSGMSVARTRYGLDVFVYDQCIANEHVFKGLICCNRIAGVFCFLLFKPNSKIGY